MDELKPGERYLLFRNGIQEKGEWTWTNDSINGYCFLQPGINEQGEIVMSVMWLVDPFDDRAVITYTPVN